MATIGYISLVIALVASLYSSAAFAFTGSRGHQSNSARLSSILAIGLVTLSSLVLLIALITHNFKLEYVAQYTSRDLPLAYRISAFWAGNNGSLLFWAWLLAIFTAIATFSKRTVNHRLVPYASAILMATEAFFLLLLVTISNPFNELPTIPPDGRGLNPLLENPGMIIHPPALLAGYVGLTVPFAFAVAALLTKTTDNRWLLSARSWTLLSWLFLGAGNLIGAWWAYVELGWGGYWAWDPVENAGLMPWLIATAFLHSAVMQKRRGVFKTWSFAMIILAFNLAIFGTFLTRSGVLSSLHTFGESRLGPFFISYLFISFVGPMVLLLMRRTGLKGNSEIESFASREFTFQLNNLLLLGSFLVIFIGTIFPALSEAVRGVKIEVGKAFFNRVEGPVFLAVLLLIGICTLIGWKRLSNRTLVRLLLWPLIPAALTVGVLIFIGIREWYAVTAFVLCVYVAFGVLFQWIREIAERSSASKENPLRSAWVLLSGNRPRYGGYLVHLAMVVIAVGITGSSAFVVEKEAALKPGESITVQKYILTYDNITMQDQEDKLIVKAAVTVKDGNNVLGILSPEMIFHRSYEQPVTEVAIRSTIVDDLYVILAGWDKQGISSFKVLVNPLVSWIWFGGCILVIGGLISFWPGRKRPDLADLEPATGRSRPPQGAGGSYCQACGAPYNPGDRFCPDCGARLSNQNQERGRES